MNEVEKVIDMCKKNSIPISTVEKECGFSNGYIVRLRKGFFPPERREKLIQYFGKDIFTDNAPKTDTFVFTENERRLIIEYRNSDNITRSAIERLLLYHEKIKDK